MASAKITTTQRYSSNESPLINKQQALNNLAMTVASYTNVEECLNLASQCISVLVESKPIIYDTNIKAITQHRNTMSGAFGNKLPDGAICALINLIAVLVMMQ